MKSSGQMLYLLKTRGPQTAQRLAELLELTSMGARRARRWQLTAAGHARFPDRHADLTLQLVRQARAVFGEAGLERLIGAREVESETQYRSAVGEGGTMADRAAALARVRDAEGYMAETLVQDDGSVLLIEHHCPICAAAAECQNFCRSELAIFQRVMGNGCTVERSEHLLAGARRCVYVIKSEPMTPPVALRQIDNRRR